MFLIRVARAERLASGDIQEPEPPPNYRIGLERDPPAEEVFGDSGKSYGYRVLCRLRVSDQPRKMAIYIVESRPFDPIILLTILANCCTMAWQSPMDPCCTPKEDFINLCEWIYLYIFTFELMVKILAYGFLLHPGAYLRDAWCQLDFVVVSLAWMPILFPSMGNYSVIRSVRALRPLRALKRVPGMPVLVASIMSVFPKLGNVGALCGFIFLVFGIVGMELFKGTLHNRLGGSLVLTGRALKGELDHHKGPLALPDGTLLPYGMTIQDKYDTEVSCSPSKGPNVCIVNEAPKNSTCHYFDRDPNAGMTSFDSIGLAFIILLQTVTFDSWASPMYQMMFAFSPYVWIYFLTICMLGGFFVVNLFLAVIFQQFIAASMVDRATGDMNARADLKSVVLEGGTRGGGAQDGALDGALDGAQDGALDTSVLLESGQERSDGEVGRGGRHCCDCEPEPGTWRHAVGEVATSDAVGNFSTGLVLFNMLLMVLPYEGMTEEYAMNLESASTVVTYIFIVEMFAKLLGIGCANYWSDGWNKLDGTIVCMSILEIVLTIIFAGGGANLSFLRIMRMLRVLRMLRLMRSWKGLYKVVSTFGKALPQMSNLLVLLTLIMTIFSLLGMQIFGAQFTPAVGFSDVPCPSGVCPNKMLSEHPYYQFDYFGPAMLTVFILMTGEWMDAMMPAIQATGKSSCLFFIICMLVGKYLIMNLLVAILLNAFADDSGDDGGKASGRASGRSSGRSTRRSNATDESDESSSMPILPTEEVQWPRDYSLFCFSPHGPTRKFTNWLIARPEFDQVVILAILASSVCLAVDNPRLDPNSTLNLRLAQLDYFWTFFFSVEMLLKVISFSFCGGPKSYITNPWNILDLIIVSISYLVLLAEIFPVFAPLKTLRILRVLRPLRLISRHPGMKLIVSSVIKSLPSVANVMGVCMMLQLVFAILGMQMFSGTMASCTKTDITVRDLCYDPTKFTGPAYLGGEPLPGYAKDGSGNLAVPGRDGFVAGAADIPMNSPAGSFDNFGEAMRLLYIMSSGDSWEEPMWTMMAATEPGHAPVRNDLSAAAIFAILWMLVGNFVALNLFVGTVVDNFTRIKKESDASATMTPEQMQWVESMKAMAKAKPIKTLREPDQFLRKMLFRLINSSAFDGLITAVIVANIGVMACDYWGIEQDVEVFAKYNSAMTTFAYIYYVEFTIKIIAMGPNGYFGDNWCRFDFTLVTCSLLDQFAAELLAQILPIPPMVLRVLRVLRILRILRLLKGAKELRNLIVTMVLSLPSLVNVGAMLALLTFIFAVLGQNLFPFLKHQDSINSMRNFESLGSAMLLLFQCLTGDGWSSLMTEAMLSPQSGKCNNELEHPNCGSDVAVPYFISFMLLGSFIFLNLVVAVILENFSSLGNINSDLVSASDVELFKEAWSELDPDAYNYIGAYKLKDLLIALPPPLGVKGTRDATREAVSRCFKIKVPTYGGVVYFQDALNCLTHYNYFEDPKTQDMLKLDVGEHETLLSKMTGNVASTPTTARTARTARTVIRERLEESR
ncbi:voltage-gated ion channel superfamily [Chrysochromulina tobinii]|uniref:Calcium-channel protein CCH1 n=1 Tax=Chrysochromulina tobinii TaxID=1460289 RepID=A0A0M0K249_9EUKA|nr:voltage-gated ion channel superfamily [Chrysochromulina tobinii]|eukprot:KOO32672.1 voltage-gated ion channel superfamily [Chrysochromulina sp. CCMP291]